MNPKPKMTSSCWVLNKDVDFRLCPATRTGGLFWVAVKELKLSYQNGYIW